MLILIVSSLTSACQTVGSEKPQPTPVEAPRIPLKDYPPQLQSRVATELRALPEGSALAGFVIDYGQLRRGVCAAEGWKQAVCLRIKASRDSSKE
jgi:hypothetical protein